MLDMLYVDRRNNTVVNKDKDERERKKCVDLGSPPVIQIKEETLRVGV